ncbi:MAG: glycosyltransferase family 2 protein [Bacteroidota bacterium]|nr:glycosyltransferase family 2 protein [Bacteroidota bacterium]
MKIAAILTCYNRKEKTLECLHSLFTILPSCEVYLVDDASTDGTLEAVSGLFPSVNIIKGDGTLFWSRGMFTAWQAARKQDYDYYLWLNDDIQLYPYCIEELLECCEWGESKCIISGLIENFEKTEILYGGYDNRKRLIQPHDQPQEIRLMNGNVVLVPKYVVDHIGIIDQVYHHDLGDVDYGLSAQKAGLKVLSTRKAVAAGYSNKICRVRKWDSSFAERFKRLYSPLGSDPGTNFYYRNKNFGFVNASCYWLYLHFINMLPDIVVMRIWGDIYCDK